MNEPTRIAAIDIGSDTVHLLVGSVDGTGGDSVVTRVEQRGELIELGRRVATKGRVSDRAAAALTEGPREGMILAVAKLGDNWWRDS